MNIYHHKFVAFEGLDGSGKTTQIDLVASAMRYLGHRVITTTELNGTYNGDIVRYALCGSEAPGSDIWLPEAELCLINAARAQHLHDEILPALEEGCWVFCDRYIGSTFAYQGNARGVPRKNIDAMHSLCCGGHMPYRNILLDISPENSMIRCMDRGLPSNYDLEGHKFKSKVRQGFIEAASQDPMHWTTYDAMLQKNQLSHMIMSDIVCF